MSQQKVVPRAGTRSNAATRVISLERGAAKYAEGSCLSCFGETRVLCVVSVEDGVPGWKKDSQEFPRLLPMF